MTYGNYTTGFEYGVIIRELMKPETTTGQNFYVGNHASLVNGEKGASDNNRGTFLQPFSTIDAAYNACKAGRGDRIYVRPGHTLSIANATTLVPDISGVQIIGLGQGELRPTITFATSTAAAIPISGANTVIANFIFKCNIASQNHMLDLTADDILIIGNDFREGTATGLSFITADGTDADCDRLRIIGNRFYAPTAGNYDNAISLAKDFTNVEIIDNYIYGDFDDAGIHVPAGGNAQVNLQIRGGEVHNIQTNIPAILINGTDSSGTISNVLLKTDTKSTALDNGSLATDNVRWASITTDQVPSEPIFVQPDSTENILGADDNDNGFASTNVAANRDGSLLERSEYIIQALVDDVAANFIGVDDANNVAATTNVAANADGSILERLEYIQANATSQTPATFVPGLGYRVTKTEDVNTATSDDLFDVTGKVLITLWTLEVTNAIGAAVTDYKLRVKTDNVDLTAAADISSAAIGIIMNVTGDSTDTLETPGEGVKTCDHSDSGTANRIVGLAGGSCTLQSVRTAGDASDAIIHTLFYLPLEASATVVAAA